MITRIVTGECLPSSFRCSPEEGQCRCLPNMVGRRCSDPAPGYFLPSLDYFLYEAELAAPLHGRAPPSSTDSPSSPLVCNKQKHALRLSKRARRATLAAWRVHGMLLCFQLNLGISPNCEQYYRQQGYDFKLSNGRIVLVRRTPRSARHRRQEQVGQLNHFLSLLTNRMLPARPLSQSGRPLRY